MPPIRRGQRSGLQKPKHAMDTNGARNTPGTPIPREPLPLPRFPKPPPQAPVHDLLVMSHGPETTPDARSNHACLNSFTSRSWIIASGG
jgi:hypothetical protein